MRVLLVHNRYRSDWPSGEDMVFDAEVALLRERGHNVETFERTNDQITGPLSKLTAAVGAVWNGPVARQFRACIKRHQPEIVHFHNTFPLISPTPVRVANAEGCGVVVTLHNYRLFCASGVLYRDGRICELCLGRLPTAAIRFGCYRGQRSATTAVVAMQLLHRMVGTWTTKVHRFITLTEFARRKVIEGGLPADRISVKPNFMPAIPPAATGPGGYALFLGRLCDYKGVETLLDAWTQLESVPLKIAGEGPLSSWARAHPAATGSSEVEFTGFRPHSECLELLRGSRFLVFPSILYEGFPLTIRDALASGRAVIASRIGAAVELVEHGVTGLHFEPGDPASLAEAVRWALAHETEMEEMGARARSVFEERYTAEANYPILMSIYRDALQARPPVSRQFSTQPVDSVSGRQGPAGPEDSSNSLTGCLVP